MQEQDLPPGWAQTEIEVIAEVNPRLDKTALADDLPVSFVPMSAVEAGTGAMNVKTTRPLCDVRKGYTPFRPGDVLFAKITPSMENGKMAVVPALRNDLGFGSTEFHVLRPYGEMCPKFLYYFTSSERFRRDAAHHMTGAVGQRRVPTSYLSKRVVPVPPAREQRRIVAKIEELFSELDRGVESLVTAREQIEVYRQALMKHAFEGKLTAEWRETSGGPIEGVDALLARIARLRESRDQQHLASWREAVQAWEDGGERGPKPSKPRRSKPLEAIDQDELAALPTLPDEWRYVRLADIARIGTGMSVSSRREVEDPVEVPYLRVANVQRGHLVLDEIKTMTIERSHQHRLHLARWDVLFNEGGDRDKLGRGWIWNCQVDPCITQNHVFRASPSLCSELHSKWISYWANSYGQRYFDSEGKQTTNLASINKTVLSHFPVPLAPVQEQETVVQRLEENVTMVDHLDEELTQALARLDGLRQAILKRASDGRLVAQDASDEPAWVLLDNIRAERHSRINTERKGTAAS